VKILLILLVYVNTITQRFNLRYKLILSAIVIDLLLTQKYIELEKNLNFRNNTGISP